jgi:hypothetical protein
MPEYKIADIDLSKIKRKRARLLRAFPTPESMAKYMLEHGILDMEQLRALQELIKQRIQESESGWFSRLMGWVWYEIKGKFVLDVGTLYMIMSKADVLIPYMPNSFWKNVVKYIDKIGEYLVEKENG